MQAMRVSGRGQRRWRGGLVGAALCLLCAASAAAEVRRVEAVGIYGIQESARRRVIPRDEAVERGTWEAVSRVALELIGEADPGRVDDDAAGTEDDASDRLAAALGKEMLPYTRSYRIVEDRGEGPVLFAEQPGVVKEYVVVVEVLVDVDRVADALGRAGLIRVPEVDEDAEPLTLEVIGLARYEGLQALLTLLRGPIGATRVETVGFARERQLIALQGPLGLEDLAIRLTEVTSAGLALEPIGVDPDRGRIRLRARYTAPEPNDDVAGR
jgi:hypothetical protein